MSLQATPFMAKEHEGVDWAPPGASPKPEAGGPQPRKVTFQFVRCRLSSLSSCEQKNNGERSRGLRLLLLLGGLHLTFCGRVPIFGRGRGPPRPLPIYASNFIPEGYGLYQQWRNGKTLALSRRQSTLVVRFVQFYRNLL